MLHTKKRKEPTAVKVHLHARLTEIGTLELWCSEADGPRSWQLHFDVRSATQTDVEAHTGQAEQQGILERETVDACRRMVHDAFPEQKAEQKGTQLFSGQKELRPLSQLPQRIAAAIDISRDDWPMTLLRQIWEALMEVEPGRRKPDLAADRQDVAGPGA